MPMAAEARGTILPMSLGLETITVLNVLLFERAFKARPIPFVLFMVLLTTLLFMEPSCNISPVFLMDSAAMDTNEL